MGLAEWFWRRTESWRLWFVAVLFVAAQLGSILGFFGSNVAYAETPPTVSDYQASNWTDTGTTETTGTFTWSAGAFVVAVGSAESGSAALSTPTATGLSFSLASSINTGDGSDTVSYVWTASPGSSGSGAVTSGAGSAVGAGISVFAFTGSNGLGATATLDNSAAKVISLTRAHNNSAVVNVMGDWNAVNDTTVNTSPAGGVVRQASNAPSRATFFVNSWGDQGSSGNTSYGITDHTGTVDMSGIVVEVRGVPGTIDQEGFRWRADDGDEDGATWLASQDVDITRTSDVATRLRMLVNTTGDVSSAQYQLEWRKVSGPTDWRKISNAPVTGQVVKTVSTGTDDAQQVGTTMTTNGTTIGASLDATTDWAGMRFQNVTVPKGATITSAFISVVPSGTGEDEPLITLSAEDADSSATFTTTASDISNRSRTSTVSWSSTDLAATGASYHNSPDLTSQIQTVIDRSGWAAGNPVTVIAQGGATSTRDLTIEAFENAGNNPPQLTINFTYPSPAFELATSSNIAASGENTTAQLTAPSGKTTSDFTTGRMQDDENPADAVDIVTDDYTELEWSIKAMSGVVANDEVYEFRVTSNGTALNTYSVTPEWTIGSTNTAPSSPTSAAQKKTDDTTLATGAWTNETSIKLTATVTDSDGGDTVKICAEVDPIGTALSSPAGDGDGCSSSGVSSGGTATVTISGLSTDTEYHWQIKAKDAAGSYSSWVTYGGNTENPPTNPAARDFGIDTSAATGGTVYDGTETDVDKSVSTSSLSQLSANWSGFNFNVAGLQKYEYSIGTTAGATDVKTWTDNSTNTSVTATGLTLQTSQMYFFNVRATDNAGNAVVRSSDGQKVAPSLSFAVSPTSITFDNLNAGNAYTSTKNTTLTTSTNAYGGYVVRAFATDSLRSSGNFTIGNFSGGSYALPDTWQSGDTGFGYTSSDTLVQGSNKFQADPCPGGTALASPGCYAPFSGSAPGDIIADHTSNVTGSPIVDEAFTVTLRSTVGAAQQAAQYQTVLVYTITPLY